MLINEIKLEKLWKQKINDCELEKFHKTVT